MWSIGLAVAATTLLIVGARELWARIFKPMLELAQAATSFGDGDLQARAVILRNDEMGALTLTFNTMAQAICDREKERLTFVATVAHDLKNPLVVIGGAGYLLKRKDLTAPEREEWLDNITKTGVRMEDMISDLTDGVQALTGSLELRLENLDLTEVAKQMVQMQTAASTTHLIRCLAEQPCPIRGDRKRLERVVMNLVSNAIKYSPAGRTVTVQVEPHGAQASLTVTDEGVGIAPDELPKLFMPFARLDRTRNMAKGTGLGLSSVKKMVEAHGGQISLSSELGVGTTVKVVLPLSATQTHASPQPHIAN